MDILSYTKASRARQTIKTMNKRLGVGEYKNGGKDVKGTYNNLRDRLIAMEGLRYGVSSKSLVVGEDGVFNGMIDQIEIIHKNLTIARDIGSIGAKVSNNMTDNITPGDEASASHNEENAWLAFDNSETPFDVETTDTFWVQYRFDTPTTVASYQLVGGPDKLASPINGILYGSYDGENYIQIHRILNAQRLAPGATKTYTTNNRERYSFYKLELSGSGHNSISSIGDVRLYDLKYKESGSWISRAITIPEDAIEFDKVELTGANLNSDNVKILTKSERDSDFIEAPNGVIASEFGKTLMIKVEFTKTTVVPNVEKIVAKYKTRSILNRLSEVEKATTVNMNKHNLRLKAIMNFTSEKMKDLIIDVFEDETSIDKYLSYQIVYDPFTYEYTGEYGSVAELVTKPLEVEVSPSNFSVSLSYEGPYVEPPRCEVSFNNGMDWHEIELDKTTDVREIADKQIRVKVYIQPDRSIHGITYSWL